MDLNSDITMMDGDDQMDPSYIPALIKPLLKTTQILPKARFRDFKALKIYRSYGESEISA
jgi:hypothetical protein